MLSDSLSAGATSHSRQPDHRQQPIETRTIDGRRADAIEPMPHATGETVSVEDFNRLADRLNELLAAVRGGTAFGVHRLPP